MTSVVIALVNLVLIGVSSFFIWRMDKRKIFWWALAFKLSCGISVGLIYKYYYTAGDTWTFFDESKSVTELLFSSPDKLIDFFWFNEVPSAVSGVDERPRAMFFLKLVSVFNLIDSNNYWITSLYFSLISFSGCWYLVRILSKYFPTLTREVTVAFLFVPSAVLWGSGIIKESISIGFLFLITGIFVQWYCTQKTSVLKIIVTLFSCWILWGLKYYWLAAWLAVVIPLILVSFLKPRVQWLNAHPNLGWISFLLISVIGISVIHPNFYFYRFFSVISENYYAFLSLSQPENVIHYYDLDASFWSMLMNAPLALVSGLFRPFIFETHSLLQVAAGLENFALISLFGISLYRLKAFILKIDCLTLALVFYVVFLSIFLALSTPNFGTLARYKIGFTPFLWFGLLSASGVLIRFKKSR